MSKKKQRPPNEVLIALMNSREDWAILNKELWYRIPEDKAPPIVRKGEMTILAFYHTTVFAKDLKWQIKHYGVVKSVKLVSRQELFPTNPPRLVQKPIGVITKSN